MDFPAMQLTQINGAALELLDKGTGEPVVFVHGSINVTT
jgi:hypothetical protein